MSQEIHNSGLGYIFKSISAHRELLRQLIKRDIQGRYRGTYIGIGWSMVNPIIMLLIYTFVFSVVLKAKWGVNGSESVSGYALILFMGLIIHGLSSEVISRSTNLVLGNPNYVKKIVFPLELLSIVSLGSALFHFSINLVVLAGAQLIITKSVPITIVFIPFVIIPFILLLSGISWFLASLGVYIRDINQTIGVVVASLLFLSPIFYPMDIVPEQYRAFMYLNPLTLIVEQCRNVMIYGVSPDWYSLLVYVLAGTIISWLGFFWFQKSRKGFADVI